MRHPGPRLSYSTFRQQADLAFIAQVSAVSDNEWGCCKQGLQFLWAKASQRLLNCLFCVAHTMAGLFTLAHLQAACRWARVLQVCVLGQQPVQGANVAHAQHGGSVYVFSNGPVRRPVLSMLYLNCSISLKNPCNVPSSKASENMCLPAHRARRRCWHCRERQPHLTRLSLTFGRGKGHCWRTGQRSFVEGATAMLNRCCDVSVRMHQCRFHHKEQIKREPPACVQALDLYTEDAYAGGGSYRFAFIDGR